MPLQAGHISSATSDFICFIMRAGSGDELPEWITYTFSKFRNQLRGVTLNNKVKWAKLRSPSAQLGSPLFVRCDDFFKRCIILQQAVKVRAPRDRSHAIPRSISRQRAIANRPASRLRRAC